MVDGKLTYQLLNTISYVKITKKQEIHPCHHKKARMFQVKFIIKFQEINHAREECENRLLENDQEE